MFSTKNEVFLKVKTGFRVKCVGAVLYLSMYSLDSILYFVHTTKFSAFARILVTFFM